MKSQFKSFFQKIWAAIWKRKWLSLAVALVIIIILSVVISSLSARADLLASYQTTTVSRGTLTATIGATGTVRARQSAILYWQTSGTVGEVNVKLDQEGGTSRNSSSAWISSRCPRR